MIRKLKIGPRLLMLLVVQAAVVMITGAAALFTLNYTFNTVDELNELVKDETSVNRLSETVRSDLMNTVNETYSGTITWEEAERRLVEAKARFEQIWKEYLAGVTPDEAEFVQDIHGETWKDIRKIYEELGLAIAGRDRGRLSLFMINDYNELATSYFNALTARALQQQEASHQAFQESVAANNQFLFSSLAIIVLGVLITGVMGVLIYRSITNPIAKIANTVHGVAAGDYSLRTHVVGQDELGELGGALDNLLEDKVTTLAAAERENETLNNSIIDLIKTVSQLSQRDLTVQVPVSEDVTGAVSDAINLMAEETARVLGQIREVAHAVGKAADAVKHQGDTVITDAAHDRQVINETIEKLDHAAAAMTQVAKLAQSANTIAVQAYKSTETAVQAVVSTSDGMHAIRETISETEKRIKRLGERSQEINSVVDIINNIAERTHVLALNASMQAAAAGEAGRGFAVVADEVQRLAESSRNSTSQIGVLVNNIQTETAESMATMNKTIGRVVEVSDVAQSAGTQMKETQEKASKLAKSVQQIAKSSIQQAKVSSEVREYAHKIQASTETTSQALSVQSSYTNKLVEFAKSLLEAVTMFRLPESTKKVSEPRAVTEALDERKVVGL